MDCDGIHNFDSGRNFCQSLQCSRLKFELEERKAVIESLELDLKSLQSQISDMEMSFVLTSSSSLILVFFILAIFIKFHRGHEEQS